MFILDTNVISAVRRADRAPQVAAFLRNRSEGELYLSVITLGEIERGIAMETDRNPRFAADLRVWVDQTVSLFADRILDVTAEDARIWGRLSAQIGNSGAELMIAAQALARGGTVVTDNTSDFMPTGVAVQNPFEI